MEQERLAFATVDQPSLRKPREDQRTDTQSLRKKMFWQSAKHLKPLGLASGLQLSTELALERFV